MCVSPRSYINGNRLHLSLLQFYLFSFVYEIPNIKKKHSQLYTHTQYLYNNHILNSSRNDGESRASDEDMCGER